MSSLCLNSFSFVFGVFCVLVTLKTETIFYFNLTSPLNPHLNQNENGIGKIYLYSVSYTPNYLRPKQRRNDGVFIYRLCHIKGKTVGSYNLTTTQGYRGWVRGVGVEPGYLTTLYTTKKTFSKLKLGKVTGV